jgi:hypothetical protein
VRNQISLSLSELSPLNPPPEDHLLVVLKSYFDGSNQADSSEYDRISIAAVSGTGKQWKRFDTDWKKVLYKHRVKYLHATDAVSLRNEFTKEKGWTDRRVDSFIGDCVKVIERHMAIPDGVIGRRPKDGLYPVTVTILFNDWVRAVKTIPELPNTIEELCATESLGFVLRWGKHIGAKKYELHFDRGEPFYGHIHTRWTHPKAQKDIQTMKDVISVDEAISMYVPALQMADLFAWCINRIKHETREWHIRLHHLPWRAPLLDYEHLIKPSRWVLDYIASWKLPRGCPGNS